jgi:hypothetical protein
MEFGEILTAMLFFYLEKQAKKAPHYAILDNQGIQDFILKFREKKKVQLCLELGDYLNN